MFCADFASCFRRKLEIITYFVLGIDLEEHSK